MNIYDRPGGDLDMADDKRTLESLVKLLEGIQRRDVERREHWYRRVLQHYGICPACGQIVKHEVLEPFATCKCPGTIEWTGELPKLDSILRVARKALS